jgi:hypothetical protein
VRNAEAVLGFNGTVFSVEVAQKLESKRDPALEEEVITWIKAKVGRRRGG